LDYAAGMLGPAVAVWSGLAAGALHVVSGVDHLAALLPLAVGRRARVFATGAAWGAGHSVGVAVIGLAGVLLRERLDIEALSSWAEIAVGVMLVGLGLFALRRALRRTHVHGPEEGSVPGAGSPWRAALAAGTLHGVAGAAHFLGVLPAFVLRGWSLPALYLASFAVGTVASMGIFAILVGRGSARLAGRSPHAVRWVTGAAGLTAVAVGLAWLA
jgi:threonine/homoserine/homoserine lactone efflux protein